MPWPIYVLFLSFICLLILPNEIHSADELSLAYRRLASIYCYIDDYSAWLEQQTNLQYFLSFAQFFNLDSQRLELELERYRLQHECLRVIERMPILVGSG